LVASPFRTATFRMVALAGSVFAVSAMVVILVLVAVVEKVGDSRFDRVDGATAAAIMTAFDRNGLDGLTAEIEARSRRTPPEIRLFLLQDAVGRRLAGNLQSWPAGAGWSRSDVTIILDGDENMVARVGTYPVPGGGVLMVGTPVPEHRQILRVEAKALIATVLSMAFIGILAGVVIARRVLGRLEAVNRTASTILAGNLSQRVPQLGRGDEFDQLAGNINSMLDRIESLLGTVRSVTDNIAHDLRAPLNRLRGRLELALMAPRRPDEYQQALAAAIGEADDIITTFNAMLTIARIEGGAAGAEFETVDLAELVETLADLYQPLAEENGLSLDVAGHSGSLVRGDRHLLSQAISNLVDNAIKYTPAGGRLWLGVTQTAGGVRLTVADSGPGIPPDLRTVVLQPFTRLDPARSTPGTGLGLSLVAAVADRHQARLSLTGNGPGLRVLLEFPPAPGISSAGR